MAHDEKLTERTREILKGSRKITEKKMFGGVTFLVDDKMFCGIQKNELMVRVGPVNYEKAVSQKYVRPMDFTGKPMVGFIYVASAGIKSKVDLSTWVEMGKDFVQKLPKKKKK